MCPCMIGSDAIQMLCSDARFRYYGSDARQIEYNPMIYEWFILYLGKLNKNQVYANLIGITRKQDLNSFVFQSMWTENNHRIIFHWTGSFVVETRNSCIVFQYYYFYPTLYQSKIIEQRSIRKNKKDFFLFFTPEYCLKLFHLDPKLFITLW